MTVDLITFCCPKDIHRLHAEGVLTNLIASHHCGFDNVIVVHQRCRGVEYRPFDYPVRIIESEDYHPGILSEFGIREDDPIADEKTHGPTAPHYWKWHVINHLIGLKESASDYIVFSDCDCTIKDSPRRSWIAEGISLLQQYPDVLIVAPSDGGHMAERKIGDVRLTQNVSQQMFLCHRERFKSIDFDIPWNWEFTAPGGPFQEYYYMLEGRIWRYMHKHQLWRAILPEQWRYWHWGWH